MRIPELTPVNSKFYPFDRYNEFSLEVSRTPRELRHPDRQNPNTPRAWRFPGWDIHFCRLRVTDMGWLCWFGLWTQADREAVATMKGNDYRRRQIVAGLTVAPEPRRIPLPVEPGFISLAKEVRKTWMGKV